LVLFDAALKNGNQMIMRKLFIAALGTCVLGVAAPLPASALTLQVDPAVASANGKLTVTDVQYRRYRNGGYYGGGRYYGRGWNNGAAVGAGIAGLAAGAIIGGAIANSQQPTYYEGVPAVGGDAVSYCMQRFRSYDPASGTYLGYDGMRHPCP
jgi:hypothetical protein